MVLELAYGLGGLSLGAGLVYLIQKAKIAALEASSHELRASRDVAVSELEEIRISHAALREEFAGVTAARKQEIKGWEEKQQALVQAQEELMQQFDALSRKALDMNSKTFLDLAKTQVEKMITKVDDKDEKRKVEMQKLVDPLSKTLKEVSDHVREVEKQRDQAYSSLTEQVKGLSEAQKEIKKEASNLVKALRKPSVRGRWGEIQLKRVVEMAGLVDHCDFEEQHSINTDHGRLRPDMIVHLPGNKIIVVDAKAPLEAYLEAVEDESEDAREEQMI